MPCAWLVLFGLTLPAVAQYQFDTWTTDNGLPQNSISAMLQTRDGYLWLATTGGLVRFDGVRFKHFEHGNTPGLASNRCSALYEDLQGTLWIGTEEEWLTRFADGVFTSYSLADGQPHGEVRRIVADEQDALWITTRGSYLRWHAGQSTRFSTQGFRLTKRLETGLGNVWWRQDGSGFHYLEQGQQYTLTEGLPNVPVVHVTADSAHHLWLILADHTLVKSTLGKLTVYAPQAGWPLGGVPFADRDGNLWRWDKGKLWTRAPDGTVVSIPGVPDKLEGIAYVDRDGGFWLGTGADGLWHARRQVITSWRPRPNAPDRVQGLNSPLIYTILQARNNALWVGSGGGGVIRYEAGRFTHYFVEDGLFGTNVTAMTEDRAGTIWIGTDHGVSRFRDGKMTRFAAEPGLRNVWAMHEDRAGNFWFTTDTGLIKYQDGNFTIYTTRDGLGDNRVRPILEARDGTLWFGTQNSLTRLADGRFTAYTEKDGLHVGQVRTLYEDSDGVLWIGTYESGLYRFQHGRFTHYTTNDGLYNNGVFQILEDASGNFWLSCNLGIYRVRKAELNAFAAGQVHAITSIAYGKQDGMPNLECNGGRQPAGWKMRDGTLWFPTMGGIAIVDPTAIPHNDTPPPVVIEEFLRNQQPQDFRQGLQLTYHQNQFEIRYTALSFLQSERLPFKYRLQGLEPEWIDAGTRRTAFYHNVPPGEYVFQVIAANSDGIWNTEGARLKIVIAPPVWQRWWFLTLVSLSVIAFFWSLHQRRVTRLQAMHTLQEAYSRRLIETQEAERKRLADGLHGTLIQHLLVVKNQALYRAQQLPAATPTHTTLTEIETTVTEALEQARAIAHTLHPPILDQLGVKSAIEDMVEKVARATPIRFTLRLDELRGLVPKETESNLFRIVEEGLNNILKHSQATAAHIELRHAAGQVQVRISDNGQGFDPATASGFGLTNLKERIKFLHGTLTTQSAPGAGTTLLIHFVIEAERQ